MPPSFSSATVGDCPASVVIAAARLSRTPLAIADIDAAGATLLFANDAFAHLLDSDPALLPGRSLSSLGQAPRSMSWDTFSDGTVQMDVRLPDGSAFPATLCVCPVTAAGDAPFCLLVSLTDARGDGAELAIPRAAEMLSRVARAAGDLMRESAEAAASDSRSRAGASAAEIALAAIERTAPAGSTPR